MYISYIIAQVMCIDFNCNGENRKTYLSKYVSKC